MEKKINVFIAVVFITINVLTLTALNETNLRTVKTMSSIFFLKQILIL